MAAVLAGWLLVARASAQMHGYVEPCSISFVEDGNTTCDECPFDHSNPASCARNLGSRGYTFKCRTRGHSAPAEVWCKPREGNELPRPFVLGGVVGGVALFAAAFLWWKRGATS
ncbi:MAG TPA: hypothetical protein VFU02_02020 [Polyangiaceae bacterium]|nr:hypothetical protein [Polyangiaceae bacterium]